ncbi:hypothetical protein [Poriferisphaera sp. WC338]|uniref:hypothetical protein n=1 Tax=Poriferisphaera sp. WC338 TaxID=3425129 RepID=UPI003D81A574
MAKKKSEIGKRFTSRKFVVSFLTQVTAMIVLLFPSHEEVIGQTSQSVIALAVLLLSSLGYVAVEGSIDRDVQKGKKVIEDEEPVVKSY